MGFGYSTGVRLRVISDAFRGCNRDATALSELSHPQGVSFPIFQPLMFEIIPNLNGLNMKRKNFSEAQIVSILQMQESGRSVKEICREHGISDGTFYNWKAKYGVWRSAM